MDIRILRVIAENFKGAKHFDERFFDLTLIKGANATGKTTINDVVTWVLFGKDSRGNEKFEVRKLNPNGSREHQTVISGEVVMSVDGASHSYKKVQEEIWQTKRGTSQQEFKGNKNTFYIDDYPVMEKEWKSRIGELIQEDLFRTLTSPTRFVEQPWKEQREVLMRLASDKSDVELAQMFGGFDEIIDELTIAPDTGAIQIKYKKALAEYNSRQVELPIRIDESMALIDDSIDESAVNAEIASIDAEIERLEGQAESAKNTDRVRSLKEDLRKAQENLKAIEADLNARRQEEIDSLKAENKVRNEAYERNFAKASEERARIKGIIASCREMNAVLNSELSAKEEEKNRCNHEWARIKAETYTEGETVCPTCGQNLPESMLMERRQLWEKKHKDEFDAIIERGNSVVAQRDAIKKRLSDNASTLLLNQDSLKDIEEYIEQLEGAHIEATKKAQEQMNSTVYKDYSRFSRYNEARDKVNALNDEIRAASTFDDTEIRQKKAGLLKRRDDAMAQLNRAEMAKSLHIRVDMLRNELLTVSENATRIQGKIELLEGFVRKKLDYISDSINAKFDGICWKLFDQQINGGIRECCELTVNGVPYGSLNNGMRIVAGLKVIQTLQQIYGTTCFIFIDNAESVNIENIPHMDNQMILLIVSDDKRLTVTGG